MVLARGLTASACAVAVAFSPGPVAEKHLYNVALLPPRQGLTTAVFDPERFGSASSEIQFGRALASGASAVRLSLYWPSVAPRAQRPATFNPSDPADAAYDWGAFDRQVRAATAKGLLPIAMVSGAPLWAQSGDDPVLADAA